MKAPRRANAVCECCGEDDGRPTRLGRFVVGGRTYDGAVCATCSTCEDCGAALRIDDDGGIECDCPPGTWN